MSATELIRSGTRRIRGVGLLLLLGFLSTKALCADAVPERETRRYVLRNIAPLDARLFIASTVLAQPDPKGKEKTAGRPRRFTCRVDPPNGLEINDFPDRLIEIERILRVIDQPTKNTDRAAALSEIWVRIANDYHIRLIDNGERLTGRGGSYPVEQ